MIARARLIGVLAFLLGGAVNLIASTQTWLSATLDDGANDPLLVSGASAVPLLTPLSLTTLALGAALSIAGPVLRIMFGILGLLLGVALTLFTGTIALTTPVDAVIADVSARTGIAGAAAVADLVTQIDPTAWPAIAALSSLVITAAGIWVLATAHRWSEGGRRYRADARAPSTAAGPLDPLDSWDDLSRGGDPTT